MTDMVYHQCDRTPDHSLYKMTNTLWYLEAETEDGQTAGYYVKFCPFCGQELPK